MAVGDPGVTIPDRPSSTSPIAPIKTRLFLGWSGDVSGEVAVALREWLPNVLPSVEPWMSEKDVTKGRRWPTELVTALETSDCGILCMTPENLDALWLHFEAGVLAKKGHPGENRIVCPLVVGLDKRDLQSPLALLQATEPTPGDFRQMLNDINALSRPLPLTPGQLTKYFDAFWPGLEKTLASLAKKAKKAKEAKKAKKAVAGEPPEPIARDKIQERLNEIVEYQREQQRASRIASETPRRESRRLPTRTARAQIYSVCVRLLDECEEARNQDFSKMPTEERMALRARLHSLCRAARPYLKQYPGSGDVRQAVDYALDIIKQLDDYVSTDMMGSSEEDQE